MKPRHDWSNMPLGLVSRPYLSRVTGISAATIAKAMISRGSCCVLSVFAVHHCGSDAFAFDAWVAAWGRDRVLEWLDQHDPNGARILRDGIGATEADVRKAMRAVRAERTRDWLSQQSEDALKAMNDRAVERRKAKRGPSQRRESIAQREASLQTMPVGLLPNLTVSKVSRASVKAIGRHMAEHGIEPYSTTTNSGFPNFAGSWSKFVGAWGADRARAWVAEHLPQYLPKFDARDSTGLLPPQYEEALKNAPLGCVPDGVISAAYGVPVYRVAEIRNKRGIERLRGGTDGAFPHRPGSFAVLIAQLGYDRARLWLAGHAPQYVEHFDADDGRRTNRKAAHTAPAPVAASVPSPKKPATGAVSKRGDAARPGIGRSVTVALAKRAERDGIAREAADRRRPPAPENGPVRAAGRVETVEEWLARGGRVTRLVGAGNANVGEVVA